MKNKTIYMLGYASDLAGANRGSGEGAPVMQKSPYMEKFTQAGWDVRWQAMLKPELSSNTSKSLIVADLCERLGAHVADLVSEKNFFTVIGGDHASAIGTWSGAAKALHAQGKIGLIWIDAHMDSHTPETSPSGNIHGMPLACLLGYGDSSLTNLLASFPKLKPENVCLIGVRSFEEGEADLLEKLGVRIFFMGEVEQRGLEAVMKEALQIATQDTVGFGVTIDIDSIDPKEAPGTGVSEENGLSANDLCHALKQVAKHENFVGAEIVEFDPGRDKEHMTEILITRLLSAMTEFKNQ